MIKLFTASLTILLLAGNPSSLELTTESPRLPDPVSLLSSETGRGSISGSMGPFEIVSADSSAVLRFQFAGQLRTDWESLDKGSRAERAEGISMHARRIRPGLTVDFPQQRIRFYLHLSAAPGSLELMDLYFNFHLNHCLQLRAGQYKVPFTRYRIQSFQRLTFVDWAIVTKGFGAERQVGFAVHNGYEQPPEWGYAAGIFTGVNARASHAVYLAKIYGEKIENPSALADPGYQAEFHPELFLHLSRNARGIRVQSDSDAEGEGLRYSAVLSAAWDLDPARYQDLALRAAPELLIKYRGLSLMTAGYAGFVETGHAYRTRLAMTGLLMQTSVRINDEVEASLRYAVVDFDKALVDDALLRAKQLISEAEQQSIDSALSRQDVDDLKEQMKNAGRILREQELTAGLNVYFNGHSLKWQNDAGLLRHSPREDDPLDDIVVRSQLQIAF